VPVLGPRLAVEVLRVTTGQPLHDPPSPRGQEV
jgi:hypothetical protein